MQPTIKYVPLMHRLIENFATLLNNKAKIVSDWYKNNFLLANK